MSPGDTSSPNPSAMGTATLSLRAPALRVLVVDDLEDAAESLAILLRKLGYVVRTAYDGVAALQVAAEFYPHAILLDLAMPKLNGFEVAQQLRQQGPKQLVCLIAISGHGQATHKERARQAGFDQHLTKPVALQELQTILKTIQPSGN